MTTGFRKTARPQKAGRFFAPLLQVQETSLV